MRLVLLAAAAWLVCTAALANAAEPAAKPNPLTALFPSASAIRDHDAVRLERIVERSLAAMPGVQTAHVSIRLPPSDAALDVPLPAPRTHVLLEATASAPTDDAVRAQINRLAPELLESLVVQRSASKSELRREESLVKVGPFTVAAPSAPPLRALIALCLCANALMAVLLLARKSRGRRG